MGNLKWCPSLAPATHLAGVATHLFQPLGYVLVKVNLLGAGHVPVGTKPVKR